VRLRSSFPVSFGLMKESVQRVTYKSNRNVRYVTPL
jgi:hypothetical protein